jgi:hypothetical protein
VSPEWQTGVLNQLHVSCNLLFKYCQSLHILALRHWLKCGFFVALTFDAVRSNTRVTVAIWPHDTKAKVTQQHVPALSLLLVTCTEVNRSIICCVTFRRSLRRRKKNTLCGDHVFPSVSDVVSATKPSVGFSSNLLKDFFKNFRIISLSQYEFHKNRLSERRTLFTERLLFYRTFHIYSPFFVKFVRRYLHTTLLNICKFCENLLREGPIFLLGVNKIAFTSVSQ